MKNSTVCAGGADNSSCHVIHLMSGPERGFLALWLTDSLCSTNNQVAALWENEHLHVVFEQK